LYILILNIYSKKLPAVVKKIKKIVLVFLLTVSLVDITFAQNETKIRVLTFNIYHGATMNGDFNLDLIASIIKSANPDFVLLQEVDYKTNRSKKMDITTILAYKTKMLSLFGRALYYDGGEYGEAILSKYSFVKTKNVLLPNTEGHEPRAAVEIIVELNNGDTISVIGTHLDHTEDNTNRIMQVDKIIDLFSRNRYPTILAGDFNAQPGSAVIEKIQEFWNPSFSINPEPTFPSNNPQKKIDYVFYSPEDRWQVLNTNVIRDSVASDHCAYLVELKLLK